MSMKPTKEQIASMRHFPCSAALREILLDKEHLLSKCRRQLDDLSEYKVASNFVPEHFKLVWFRHRTDDSLASNVENVFEGTSIGTNEPHRRTGKRSDGDARETFRDHFQTEIQVPGREESVSKRV